MQADTGASNTTGSWTHGRFDWQRMSFLADVVAEKSGVVRVQSLDLDRSSPVPMQASTSGSDDWELDPADIVFQEKIAAGAFGDLYKGVYCGQDVAIKILRNVQDDTQQYQEFLQACTAALGARKLAKG